MLLYNLLIVPMARTFSTTTSPAQSAEPSAPWQSVLNEVDAAVQPQMNSTGPEHASDAAEFLSVEDLALSDKPVPGPVRTSVLRAPCIDERISGASLPFTHFYLRMPSGAQ